jgi:hypothetical protein
MESEPGVPQMQMTLRIESLQVGVFVSTTVLLDMLILSLCTQSLETQDARTNAHVAGSHSSSETIVENMVFQLRTSSAENPWIAINTVPTLTPLQSIGKMDRDLKQLVAKKKRTRLTIVA